MEMYFHADESQIIIFEKFNIGVKAFYVTVLLYLFGNMLLKKGTHLHTLL